jgi:hypothetical protein
VKDFFVTKEVAMPIVDSSSLTTFTTVHEDPRPANVAPRGRPIVTESSAPFDDGRWNAWVTQGRLADAAFTERMRTLAMLGAAAAMGVVVIWVILG